MALQQRVSTRSRTAFSGVRVAGHGASVRAVAMNRSRGVSVNAMVREWPDKEFIAETLSIFPDEGVANAEQARVSLLNAPADHLLLNVCSVAQLSMSTTQGPLSGDIDPTSTTT
jgi:hypothetical protein